MIVLQIHRKMVRVTSTVCNTPLQIQTRRQKLLICNGAKNSPPTPHRIELRNDEFDPKKIIFEPSAPKCRKKLLNGTVLNNHNEIKHQTKDKPKGNHKLTEYFTIRRSARKTKTTVLEEKQLALERLVKDEVEDGLEVRYFKDKGRGVVAAKHFFKGDFVVEYSGELVDILEAKQREATYAQNENAGCYMYYFRYNDQQYCIDATAESGKLGRLVNHSRNGNLITKTMMIDKKPRLILVAKEDIKIGEEILYDYGDRSKESLKYHPWLAY
ncbi:histone-lysine N-methyltransferase PR-Set7-like isoform X2 [Cylas formicarius]|uniref:histone-lysine N-methyltransferase PR-Set7-like isoform X2 n=1 Tax=Cylas formicarius TaxID=197179 RepID=UPI0029586B05|nr:histone-lysine N-methyltransferase PR-Set7-like isoform X2 [Cylas formicarius]